MNKRIVRIISYSILAVPTSVIFVIFFLLMIFESDINYTVINDTNEELYITPTIQQVDSFCILTQFLFNSPPAVPAFVFRDINIKPNSKVVFNIACKEIENYKGSKILLIRDMQYNYYLKDVQFLDRDKITYNDLLQAAPTNIRISSARNDEPLIGWFTIIFFISMITLFPFLVIRNIFLLIKEKKDKQKQQIPNSCSSESHYIDNDKTIENTPQAFPQSSFHEEINNITDNNPLEMKFCFSALPDEKQNETVYIHEWYKEDGDWVEEGKPLYRVRVGEHFGDDKNMFYVSQPMQAGKSGIVQICKQKYEVIHNGEVFYIIHPIGSYSKENIPSNSSFIYYFDRFRYNLSVEHIGYRLYIEKWYKEDGQFVDINELVFSINHKISNSNESFLHYSEKRGYLDKVFSKSWYHEVEQKELIYIIHDNAEDRVNRKFINIPEIKLDDFTHKKILKWSCVGSNKTSAIGITSIADDSSMFLTFSFNNEDNKDFIVFQFLPKQLILSKDDVVSFLFEDGRRIDFVLIMNSYKILSSSSEKVFENKIIITDNELQHFEQSNFSKWKIILKKQNREIIGGSKGAHAYKSKQDLMAIIKKFTKEYRDLVIKEIPNYTPILERSNCQTNLITNDSEECYVYLMIDTNNNFHKIGISNKPGWREKTLQSEKPTIELLACKKFVSRKIASSFEKALHDTYSSKRIRGEWFQLDLKDVLEIELTLNS